VHFDEVVFRQLSSFKNFKFLNIESETDDFLTKNKKEDQGTTSSLPEEDVTAYTLWIRNELDTSVTKVVLSKRLTDSPCIVTSPISASMKSMMMMFQQGEQQESGNKDLTFEINPNHEIIMNINRLRKEDPRLASLTIKQLYDAAILQSNLPIQNKDYVKRTQHILKALLDLKFSNPSRTEDVKVERLQNESLQEAKEGKKKNADMFAEFKVGKDGKIENNNL